MRTKAGTFADSNAQLQQHERTIAPMQKGAVTVAEATKAVYLTTIDNPYDPVDEFDNWLIFDNDKGYGTLSYLGRIARTSDAMSDVENQREIERAIDDILAHDFMGIYRKICEK